MVLGHHKCVPSKLDEIRYAVHVIIAICLLLLVENVRLMSIEPKFVTCSRLH